jgi:hypothetical protein
MTCVEVSAVQPVASRYINYLIPAPKVWHNSF